MADLKSGFGWNPKNRDGMNWMLIALVAG